MKSTTLMHLIALPSAFANLLGVDIVASPLFRHLGVRVKIESADQHQSPLVPDEKDDGSPAPEKWCLTGNQWTKFCKDKNVVQVMGHVNFSEPTAEPRLVNLSVLDIETPTAWTASCDINVIGGNGIENVIWDMTKLEVGLLNYDLKQGFKTVAIDIECGEGWVNPARKGNPWYMDGTFAEAFPWNL